MTHAQRNEAILNLLETYTANSTKTKKTARAALVAEGIYLENGKLAPEFGGPKRKAKVA
jgi:hypothetical protein